MKTVGEEWGGMLDGGCVSTSLVPRSRPGDRRPPREPSVSRVHLKMAGPEPLAPRHLRCKGHLRVTRKR